MASSGADDFKVGAPIIHFLGGKNPGILKSKFKHALPISFYRIFERIYFMS